MRTLKLFAWKLVLHWRHSKTRDIRDLVRLEQSKWKLATPNT